MLCPIADRLKVTIDIIGRLDFIFARAKYSKRINGIRPIITDSKEITLLGARHPLIDKK